MNANTSKVNRIYIIVIIICSLLIAGVIGYKDYPESKKLNFVIELESIAPGTGQLFFDIGHGYSETDSITRKVEPWVLKKYSFPLPELPIKSIRFDPLNSTSVVAVKNAGIENALGDTLKSFPAHSFISKGQISSMDISEGVLAIHTTENANDPQTIIENSSFERSYGWIEFLAKHGWKYAGYALLSFHYINGTN